MRKFIKKVISLTVVLSLFGLGVLLADKKCLSSQLVRLHVVANSDSAQDQAIKLQVRDAVLGYLRENMAGITDAQEAKTYLCAHLRQLEQIANLTLQKLGVSDCATVSLTREEFDIRKYDTFTLPSGVYDSLRVQIGNGAGQNWWCVVFPALCTGATTQAFKDTAVSSGFDDSLASTLADEGGYEIRFFFLDCLGKLENLFFIK